MASIQERQQALSVMGEYAWKYLCPGENDKTFEFEGPGIALLCKRVSDDGSQYQVLKVYSADDALEIAKRLLAQPRADDSYLYAMLASEPDLGKRAAVGALLQALCN